MSSSPSVSSLTFDSWAEPSAHGGAPPPRWGAAVVFSILAHALVLAAAGRIAWTRLEPAPAVLTEFVWLGVLPVPVPVESPQAAPVESVPVEPEQAPPQPAIVVEPPTDVAAERPPSGSSAPPDNASAQAREAIAEPQSVRSADWSEERKRAIAAALAQHARDTEFSAFAADDRLEALPAVPEARPTRSIFDSQSSGGGGGRSLMQPGQARTRLGRRAREFCNALTAGAGISLFGFATLCGSPADYEPSGLFPEVMPEWLKRMPECVETRPLGPLLAEPSEFPTIKCRMVPKDDGTGAVP